MQTGTSFSGGCWLSLFGTDEVERAKVADEPTLSNARIFGRSLKKKFKKFSVLSLVLSHRAGVDGPVGVAFVLATARAALHSAKAKENGVVGLFNGDGGPDGGDGP